MSGVLIQQTLWVGQHYRSGGGPFGQRLLLAAEPQAREPGAVRQVGRALEAAFTADYISGEMKHVLWTQIARVVLGSAAPREACEHFWKCVAFTNPAPSDWLETAQGLAPQAVLVLGASLWSTLPGATSTEAAQDATVPTWSGLGHFRLSNEVVVPAACVPHPGAPGFSFRDWTALVARLLTDAGAS